MLGLSLTDFDSRIVISFIYHLYYSFVSLDHTTLVTIRITITFIPGSV
jgi:hypothetical protein